MGKLEVKLETPMNGISGGILRRQNIKFLYG